MTFYMPNFYANIFTLVKINKIVDIDKVNKL